MQQEGGNVYVQGGIPMQTQVIQINHQNPMMNNAMGYNNHMSTPMNNDQMAMYSNQTPNQMYINPNPNQTYDNNPNTMYGNQVYNNHAMGGGQPNSVSVVRNQINFITDPTLIQIDPVPLFCGRCNNTVLSRVETNCSYSNCCCCLCTGPVLWLCFQCCRGKAVSCNNAKHFCPSCSAMIGQYEAC
jgi:hypothetical protein